MKTKPWLLMGANLNQVAKIVLAALSKQLQREQEEALKRRDVEPSEKRSSRFGAGYGTSKHSAAYFHLAARWRRWYKANKKFQAQNRGKKQRGAARPDQHSLRLDQVQ